MFSVSVNNLILVFTFIAITNGMPYEPLQHENSTSWPENSTEILAEKLTMLGLKSPRKTLNNPKNDTKIVLPNIPVHDSSKNNKTPSKIGCLYENLKSCSSGRKSLNLSTLKHVFQKSSNNLKDSTSFDETHVEIKHETKSAYLTESKNNVILGLNKDTSVNYSNSKNDLFTKNDLHFDKNDKSLQVDFIHSTAGYEDVSTSSSYPINFEPNMPDFTNESESTTVQSQNNQETSELNNLSDENTLVLINDLNNFAGAIYNMDVKSFSEHLSNQDTMLESASNSNEFDLEEDEMDIKKEVDNEVGRDLRQQSFLRRFWTGLSHSISVLSTQLTARRQHFKSLESKEK